MADSTGGPTAMICLIPAENEEDQLQVAGADRFEQQHVTLGYYGEIDNDMAAALRAAALRIAVAVDPFVAEIVDYGPLGKDDPPADVLFLDDSNLAFTRARMELPPVPTEYQHPTFIPHITVGYGVDDGDLAQALGDGQILFDAVAFVDGDEWDVYDLGIGAPPDDTYPVVAVVDLQDVGEAERLAAGIDGTMGDAQDVPHPFKPLEDGTCMICGLHAEAPAHMSTMPVTAGMEYSAKQLAEWAKNGVALPDRSYPIPDKTALDRAIQAIGRAKNRKRVEAHIKARARSLNATKQLPDWLGAQTASIPGYQPGHGWDNPAAIVAALGDPADTSTPVTAAIRDHIAKPSMPGGSKRGRKNRRQKCFHGSPATCRSVKWIAVYTALREKRGMTKEAAARIANSMHNRWKTGAVGPRNHHPIVRKTI